MVARLEEEAAAHAEQLARAEYNLKRVEFRIELDEKRRKVRAEAAGRDSELGGGGGGWTYSLA